MDVNSSAFGTNKCGGKAYSITTVPFLTLTEGVLYLQSDDSADLGHHLIDLTVTMIDYPVISLVVQFSVQIEDCAISGLDAPSIANQFYTVYDPELIVTWGEFIEQPVTCGYT